VTLDGQSPLWCKSLFIESNQLQLHSLIATVDGFLETGMQCQQYEEETVVCSKLEDLFSPSLYHRSSSSSLSPPCILLRACLVVAKLFSTEMNLSLQDQLSEICHPQGLESNDDNNSGNSNRCYRGLKIISCSRIPSGSGMGGSSILSAVVLKSLFHLLLSQDEEKLITSEMLVRMVGQVEQLLTTGGGWQDQIGGIYPGFKLCQSHGTLESPVTVKQCSSCSAALQESFFSRFSERTCLIYSGVQVSSPLLSSSSLLISFPPCFTLSSLCIASCKEHSSQCSSKTFSLPF
jgi:hypothetical protein